MNEKPGYRSPADDVIRASARTRSGRSGMRPGDIIRQSSGSLHGNRLRSSLTILGVAVGVFSVVGVMTALTAIRSSIDSGLHVFGAGAMEISKYPAIQLGGSAAYRARPDITYGEYRRFRAAAEGITTVIAPLVWRGGVSVSFEGRETEARMGLAATNEHFLALRNYTVTDGRNLTSEDTEFARPVAVIGNDIREALFPATDPIGRWIRVGHARYQVIGLLESRGTSMGNNYDHLLIVPITRYRQDWGSRYENLNITLQSPSVQRFEECREAAIGAMRLARGLEPGEENNFEIFSNETLLEAFGRIARMVGTGGFVVSGIALMAAGVGIMNIMLVSVTERTREIGLRMAVGARRKDILRQFLMEAVLLSEVGAVCGILVGVLIGNAAVVALGVSMIFPWFWAGVAIVICSLVGITFGIYPAWKAAMLKPVQALHHQ